MICTECHCTIQDEYRGACVTCLRRENARLAAELAKLQAIVERLYHSSGPMEWLDSHCEEIAEMIYEAAEAGEETE